MRENTYSLKDIKNMQNPINKRNKKIEIEKRNLEASVRIRAHNKIMESSRKKEIEDFRESIKGQLRAGYVPLDAYIEVYNDRIKVLTSRVEALQAKKESNGGMLTAGGENQLNMYQADLDKIIKEKKEFLDNKESELKQIEKEQEEYLLKQEEERKLQEAKREAAKKMIEDAAYGRKKMIEDVKREIIEEELDKTIDQ